MNPGSVAEAAVKRHLLRSEIMRGFGHLGLPAVRTPLFASSLGSGHVKGFPYREAVQGKLRGLCGRLGGRPATAERQFPCQHDADGYPLCRYRHILTGQESLRVEDALIPMLAFTSFHPSHCH